MSRITKMTKVQRDLIQAIVDKLVVVNDNTTWLTEQVQDQVRTLAEAGDLVACSMTEAAEFDGYRARVEVAVKRAKMTWADPDGKPLSMPQRVGVPARDQQGAEVGTYQQPLFISLTRDQFQDWYTRQLAQRRLYHDYARLGARISAAWDAHPAAATVEQVCDLAGIELPPELLEAS